MWICGERWRVLSGEQQACLQADRRPDVTQQASWHTWRVSGELTHSSLTQVCMPSHRGESSGAQSCIWRRSHRHCFQLRRCSTACRFCLIFRLKHVFFLIFIIQSGITYLFTSRDGRSPSPANQLLWFEVLNNKRHYAKSFCMYLLALRIFAKLIFKSTSTVVEMLVNCRLTKMCFASLACKHAC